MSTQIKKSPSNMSSLQAIRIHLRLWGIVASSCSYHCTDLIFENFILKINHPLDSKNFLKLGERFLKNPFFP